MIKSCWILLRMKNVSEKSSRESQNTVLCLLTFLWKSCCSWDNVEKYGRPRQATDDYTMWGIHFVCWVSKAIDTNPEYVILFAFHDNNVSMNVPQCMYTFFLISV